MPAVRSVSLLSIRLTTK